MYGRLKADVRDIIKRLCDYRNIEIIEGAVCSDHVHLCLSIPPSEKVSDVVGYIKGKSALMIHDKYPEMTNGWTKAFWASGFHVENSFVFANDTGLKCISMHVSSVWYTFQQKASQQSRTANLHRRITFHNQSADLSACAGRPLADFRSYNES